MKQSYPLWKFHQEKSPEGLIVRSEEQDLALGSGWVDTPAKFGAPLETKVLDAVVAESLVDEPKKRGRRAGVKQ